MPQQKQAEKFIKDNGVVCVAILCLTALEVFALYNGINGTLFTFIVAVIAGLAGLVLPTPKFLKGGK